MISTGFRALDAAIGGLAERKDYLIYGPVGSGKSGFALNFLHAGLTSGEVVALVTRRPPRMVLEHGANFGWDLESFVADNRLILIEYTPKILQNTAGPGDESQIVSELYRMLENSDVRRIVFDPLTPMLEGTINVNVAFRCRALIEQLSQLGATSMYVMDTPESDPYVHQCKDQFHGMMRFEWLSLASHAYRLTMERSPTSMGQAVQVDFQLQYMKGLTELSSGEYVSGKVDVRRKVLTIVPAEQRQSLRNLLSRNYIVSEAENPADGMAKIATFVPDVIVISREGQEIDGLEVCRTLRANGLNVPIIITGEHLRRARDRVEISAVGADACLQRPLDGRLLTLEIQKLLHRYDPAINRMQGRLPDVKLLADLQKKGPNRTSDSDYFFQRLEQEIAYSSENSLSFSVLLLRPEHAGLRELHECAQQAESLIRDYDVIFTTDRMVGVLLAEADEGGAAAFLKGLHGLYKAELPHVTYRAYQQQPDFMDNIKHLFSNGGSVDDGCSTAERACDATH